MDPLYVVQWVTDVLDETLQGGVARLRRLRVLAWAYLLHRRCRKAAAEDRSQTFENVNE